MWRVRYRVRHTDEYMGLSSSALLKIIVEVVLTFSLSMLNKKLERMTSNPKDKQTDDPITMGVTFSTSSGPKFAPPQIVNA
jgi:hypothetical protein